MAPNRSKSSRRLRHEAFAVAMPAPPFSTPLCIGFSKRRPTAEIEGIALGQVLDALDLD